MFNRKPKNLRTEPEKLEQTTPSFIAIISDHGHTVTKKAYFHHTLMNIANKCSQVCLRIAQLVLN